jgi:hypothetical protein
MCCFRTQQVPPTAFEQITKVVDIRVREIVDADLDTVQDCVNGCDPKLGKLGQIARVLCQGAMSLSQVLRVLQ